MESEARAKETEECYISRLPYHMIKLIFCKLPVFCLTKCCRYVCKLWQQIIMDPDFAKSHRATRNPADLFLCIKDGNLYWLEFHGKSHYFNLAANLDYCKSLVFLNSCNGLVCACQGFDVLQIINPITCEYIAFPPCGDGMSLYTTSCGVGFDLKAQKFKVLRCMFGNKGFVHGADDEYLRFEVCTLGNGTWRRIMDPPRFDCYIWSNCSGASVNGSFHFIAVLWEGRRICAFDFASEQFRSMLLPPVFYDTNYNYHFSNLGAAKDSIYIGCFANAFKNLEVWVMKEHGIVESWTKMLVIDCQPIRFKIMLLESGDSLLYDFPDCFLCSPETTRLTKLGTQGIQSTKYPIIVHSPSFTSLKDIIGDTSKVLHARARP